MNIKFFGHGGSCSRARWLRGQPGLPSIGIGPRLHGPISMDREDRIDLWRQLSRLWVRKAAVQERLSTAGQEMRAPWICGLAQEASHKQPRVQLLHLGWRQSPRRSHFTSLKGLTRPCMLFPHHGHWMTVSVPPGAGTGIIAGTRVEVSSPRGTGGRRDFHSATQGKSEI